MNNKNKLVRNRIAYTASAYLALILPTVPAAIAQEPSNREEPKKGLHPEEFAQHAAWTETQFIALSEVAEKKTQNEDVRNFAQTVIRDHKAAHQKLRSIAEQNGVELPGRDDFETAGAGEEFGEKLEPAKRRDIDEYRKLQTLEGEELDKHYLREMVKNHTKAIGYFEKGSKQLSDPELKQFAEEQLPMLRDHRQEAERLVKTIHKGGEGKKE